LVSRYTDVEPVAVISMPLLVVEPEIQLWTRLVTSTSRNELEVLAAIEEGAPVLVTFGLVE
jgi:hypothetical protein